MRTPRRRKPQAPPPFDKRLVLLQTSGPYAGLHRIAGTESQGLAILGTKSLPTFVPDQPVPPNDRQVAAGMVKVTPRYVLYKECAGPTMQRFDETMHPAQQ